MINAFQSQKEGYALERASRYMEWMEAAKPAEMGAGGLV